MNMEIIKGKSKKPPRVVLYGTEGIGKSTFAAQAKSPIMIQTEDGADEIEVHKFPIAKSHEAVMECIQFLATNDHEYKTCIVDTWDTMEQQNTQNICKQYKVNNLNQAAGGYGAGKGVLLGMMKEVIDGLQYLREEKGMTIIVLAHSKVLNVSDPQYGGYDQFTLSCIPDVTSQLVSWADIVGFANNRMRIDEDTGLARAIGAEGGERVIYTVRTPAYVAKNRYGMKSEIPLDWKAFITEVVKNG